MLCNFFWDLVDKTPVLPGTPGLPPTIYVHTKPCCQYTNACAGQYIQRVVGSHVNTTVRHNNGPCIPHNQPGVLFPEQEPEAGRQCEGISRMGRRKAIRPSTFHNRVNQLLERNDVAGT